MSPCRPQQQTGMPFWQRPLPCSHTLQDHVRELRHSLMQMISGARTLLTDHHRTMMTSKVPTAGTIWQSENALANSA